MIQQKNKEVNLLKKAGKRIVQKSAEATGDLIGNKIADKINSLGKSKNNEKETSEEGKIIIPLEKRQKIISDLRLFLITYKNGIPKDDKLIRQHT